MNIQGCSTGRVYGKSSLSEIDHKDKKLRDYSKSKDAKKMIFVSNFEEIECNVIKELS